MNALRCIHVGVGAKSRGAWLLDLFPRSADRFAPVAFVDASREIARAEADRRGWSSIACFGSLPEALGAVKADAAIITSPARFHGEQIRLCLEAGLHVFVAKPMTYDLDEAVRLVELAERKRLSLVVDQQQRFLLTERTLAEWAKAKRFGELGYVAFQIHRYRPEMLSFTGADPFIWEQGVHSFNSLLAMTGRQAHSVFAHQLKPAWSKYNGPTVSMGVIELDGGVPCEYLGTFDSRAFTMDIRFEYEQAAVRLVAAKSFHKRIEIARPGQAFEPAGIDDGHDQEPAERFNFEAFHRGCMQGGRVVNDGRENLQTLAVVDAFIRSARSGRKEMVRRF